MDARHLLLENSGEDEMSDLDKERVTFSGKIRMTNLNQRAKELALQVMTHIYRRADLDNLSDVQVKFRNMLEGEFTQAMNEAMEACAELAQSDENAHRSTVIAAQIRELKIARTENRWMSWIMFGSA
jgi:hypothetical protein